MSGAVSMRNRNPRYSIAAIKRMYVHEYLTQREIAERLGVHRDTVNRMFARHGIEARMRTSTRTCRVCGQPVEKMLSRTDPLLGRVFSGTLCHEHRLERIRKYKADHAVEMAASYERYAKSDKGRETDRLKHRRWRAARKQAACAST